MWQYTDPRTGKSMNWRYSQVASGGTLNEKCCHYFDILNWMVGKSPERVTCDGGLQHYQGRETWDHATLSLEYPGGARASFSLCMFAPHRLELQVVGSEGSLMLMPDHLLYQKRGTRTGEKLELPKETDHGERGPERGIETAVLKMYEDFRDCIRTGKKPFVTPETALASSRIAFLGEKSSSQKKTVDWDG